MAIYIPIYIYMYIVSTQWKKDDRSGLNGRLHRSFTRGPKNNLHDKGYTVDICATLRKTMQP